MHGRLPLIKINYKYIINFIFKPVRRNLLPIKEEKAMTELTLTNHHRTMWHFIPGLALSAVITGVALWVVPFPLWQVPGSAPSP